MDNAEVSERGEIIIPREVCESVGLHPGDRFGVIVMHGSITIAPVPTWEELRGVLKGANTEGIRDEEDRF